MHIGWILPELPVELTITLQGVPQAYKESELHLTGERDIGNDTKPFISSQLAATAQSILYHKTQKPSRKLNAPSGKGHLNSDQCQVTLNDPQQFTLPASPAATQLP